jgi:hypothetical protein
VSSEGWIPEDVPLDRPSAARLYDFLLGGYHNFEADRRIAAKMVEVHPEVRLVAQANRAFLRRAVHYLVEQGIEQILDLGSGIPTVGNVHQVAQAANPNARVVYVDIDPVAVAHSKVMLEDNPRATAIRADVRYPEAILSHSKVQGMLDFDQPLGLLLVAILHYVLDDKEADNVVRTIGDVMVPGSYVAITHSTTGFEAPAQKRLRELFGQASPAVLRSRAQIEQFFDGFELVEPGLVYTPLWRPEGPDDLYLDQPERSFMLAGVARKL